MSAASAGPSCMTRSSSKGAKLPPASICTPSARLEVRRLAGRRIAPACSSTAVSPGFSSAPRAERLSGLSSALAAKGTMAGR